MSMIQHVPILLGLIFKGNYAVEAALLKMYEVRVASCVLVVAIEW